MNECIVILGMHRSGTSAFAGALRSLGVEFGQHLMPANDENVKGFFEHVDIYKAHEALLRACGRSWDDMRPMPPGWLDTRQAMLARSSLVNTLRREFAQSALWCVKDPRLCRLLPLWNGIFARLEVTPRFVIVWREPKEVAASLRNRNGFSFEKSGLLWSAHILEAEFHTRSQERSFISYHELLKNPGSVMERLADDLSLKGLAKQVDLSRHLASAIDPELHHERGRSPIAADFGRAAKLIDCVRGLLEDADPNSSATAARIDTLRVQHTEVIQQVDPLLLDQAASLSWFSARLRDAISDIDRVSTRVDEISAHIESLERILEERTHWLQIQAGEIKALWHKAHYRGLNGLLRGVYEKLSKLIVTTLDCLPMRRVLRETNDESTNVATPLVASVEQFETQVRGATREFPALPAAKDPLVSVVIPVYGQAGMTVRCLTSIVAASDRNPIEVIVVDDASPDGTAEKLAEISNLKIVRNESNLGFVDSCNRGALAARGKFVLFLNNDTIVQNGWLDALVQTFNDFENVGLVGAKLISSDGTLQEAGGIIWNDGSGWNVGRGKNADAPQYNYARDVDYCSGACLMIPRSLFFDLRMFDTLYRPGYYEDTDLAFRVRHTGKRVLYQPASQVIHMEGATSGTDLTQGMKRYQVRNQERFRTRWKDVLSEHRSPGRKPEMEMERHVKRRALVVDHRVLTPDQDSGSLRMFNLLRVLQSAGFKVTFLPDNLQAMLPYTYRLQSLGVEVVHAPHIVRIRDHLKQSGKLYDLVLLSRVNVAAKHVDDARRFCPQAQIVFDTVDLHFLREKREAELSNAAEGNHGWHDTMMRELAVAHKSDVTFVVSPVEKQLLRHIAPAVDVRVLSNIHEVLGCDNSFEQRRNVLFIGGFEHPPNVDAVVWLTRKIMPLVWAKIPSMKLYVIGSKPTEQVLRLSSERTEVLGYVPDVKPFFERCRLSVAPLRYGAGVKGKVNQSLAYGLPCVATPLAAEGMALRHGEDIMIADRATTIADAIVKVYENQQLWQQLSDGGMKNIERHFSFNAARTVIEELIGDASETPDRGQANKRAA